MGVSMISIFSLYDAIVLFVMNAGINKVSLNAKKKKKKKKETRATWLVVSCDQHALRNITNGCTPK